jgi:hypothetical protein
MRASLPGERSEVGPPQTPKKEIYCAILVAEGSSLDTCQYISSPLLETFDTNSTRIGHVAREREKG